VNEKRSITTDNSNSNSFVIAFLVVNRIKDLPNVAIASALAATSANIVIGYIDSADLVGLPKSNRISYIELENQENAGSKSRKYSNFLTEDFYRIVKLKWFLLKSIIDSGYAYIIYSDTDVIWNLNPIPTLFLTFAGDPETDVLIQSFTTEPHSPNLCMGFVCFRNSQRSLDFILMCEASHLRESLHDKRVGDDTIATKLFSELGYPKWIKELPQGTFPTGWFINLYRKKSRFPSLNSPVPFIFHTNWVVGLDSKRLLTRVFLSARQRKTYSVKMTFIWRLRLPLFRLKHQLKQCLARCSGR
jgi:hypothetical protein